MRAGRSSVAARATTFSLVCVALAAAAHVQAAGSAPPPWVVATAVPAVALIAAPLAGRARGLPVVAAAMIGLQAVLHAAFSLATPDAGGGSAVDRLLCSAHHVHPAALAGHTLALASTPGRDQHMAPAMLATHLTAAVLAAAWLRRTDRAVTLAADLVRALAGAVRRHLTPLPTPTTKAGPSPSDLRAATARRRPRPPATWADRTPVRRGPPLPACA